MTAEMTRETAEKVQAILQTKMKDMQITIKEIPKQDGMKTTVMIGKKEDTGMEAGAVFYIENIMENTKDPDQIAQAIMDAYTEEKEDKIDRFIKKAIVNDILFKKEEILNNVMPAVIPQTTDPEYLKNIPCKPFLNLIIVPAVIVSEKGRSMNVKITKGLCEMHGITEDELFDAADKNFKTAMNDAENDLPYDQNIIDRISDAFSILTTGVPGTAGYLLKDTKTLHAFGRDLIIIPSSVHELLVLSECITKQMSPAKDDLKPMIEGINETLMPSEVLSNTPYRYCYATDTVELL